MFSITDKIKTLNLSQTNKWSSGCGGVDVSWRLRMLMGQILGDTPFYIFMSFFLCHAKFELQNMKTSNRILGL